ncbi:MAG: ImmA/IrrE family metallo-endopeptidase [Microcystaceae cyanobacterium]
MPEGWLIQAVEYFWTCVGKLEPFPRCLENDVSFALPVSIYKYPCLQLKHIATDLERWNIPLSIASQNSSSRLHGCLVAYAGGGHIFLDETDSLNEQRFSLAHEVAHFILDYQQPRQKAIAEAGQEIVEVLDGIREITIDERITAILSNITIGPYINLIERLQDGTLSSSQSIEIEDRADRLALELLAPADEVRQSVEKNGLIQSSILKKALITDILSNNFGLPLKIAEEYNKWLYREWYGDSSFRDWLNI